MTGLRLALVCFHLMLLAYPGYAMAFGLDDVADKARALAGEKYQKPEAAPDFLKNLSYSDYQSIRFKPEQSLWRADESRFQAMMVPRGNVYSNAVQLNVIDGKGVGPVEFDKSRFEYPSQELAKRIPADLGYAGFRLTYPLSSGEARNQFLVFAGASYFRGVGAGQTFGLSGRGIAVDTGLPSGEEFPAFTEFWMERPSTDSKSMVVYGLLDGPSLTGAYRFDIHPGKSLKMDVTAKLFFRNDIELLGQAPLTSMFYYGENTLRPTGEWRPQVHDSDGLLIYDGKSGEWLWRPVVNPTQLERNYYHVEDLKGFGLLQRDRQFAEFQDNEARYDRRPSMWVTPRGGEGAGWGEGEVVLVEIPTRAETNDNIVAFFKPRQSVKSGETLELAYTVTVGEPGITGQPNARAVRTYVGAASDDSTLRFIVDFKGGELTGIRPDATVVSQASGGDGTEVVEHFVEYVEASDLWRLSMLAKTAPGQRLALRGALKMDGEPVTETWTYILTPGTGLLGKSQ